MWEGLGGSYNLLLAGAGRAGHGGFTGGAGPPALFLRRIRHMRIKTFIHTASSGNSFDAVRLADLIGLLAHATGQEAESISKIVVPNGADYALIFRPKAPKVEAPKESEGAAPLAEVYQYCEVGGVKYRWKAGMADWEVVPVMKAPPPPVAKGAAPPMPGSGMISRAAVMNAARRKTRKAG